MEAVMLSIRPEWCSKIASGRKTVELRKTKPKLEIPFKCYIYQTKPKSGDWNERDGRVIGEFICDSFLSHCEMANADIAEQTALVKREKIREYSNGKEVFGWHISELQIYDKPKKLSEFLVEDNRTFDCPQLVAMKHAPQSWCYVEGVRDNG